MRSVGRESGLGRLEPNSACARSSPTEVRHALSANGRPREGPGALTTASTMYREMGMTFWLEKVDAELGGVER